MSLETSLRGMKKLLSLLWTNHRTDEEYESYGESAVHDRPKPSQKHNQLNIA